MTSGPWDRALLACAALFLAAVAAVVIVFGESPGLPWMNHDAANALYVGCRLLEGDTLYVDWLYYVMPPVVFLSTAACGVAQATGLSPPTVLHLFFLASAALGLRVLRQAFPAPATRSLGLLLAYLVLVVSSLLFLDRGGSLPRAFGQREQLFALFFVPYLFWRASGQPASGAVRGLLAGLGFVMMVKPHLAAAVLASELVFLRAPGRRRVVWLPLAAGALLPFGALLLHSPAAFGAFFDRALAYHLSDAYDPYGRGFSEFFWSRRHADVLVLIGAAFATGAWAVRRGAATRPLYAGACVAILVLYLGFLQQGKFFFYHLIPTAGLAFVACAAFSGWIVQSLAGRVQRRVGRVLLALPLFALLGLDLRGLQEIFRESPAGRPAPILPLLANRRLVALVTPSVEGAIFRYALSHELTLMRPWTSNYTVPALLQIEDPRARRKALRRYFAPLVERIRAEAPELVLFSPGHAGMGDERMHGLLVEGLRLFPIAGYRLLRGSHGDWLVYERVAPVDRHGRAAAGN